jgi:signal transduction histidine kinase
MASGKKNSTNKKAAKKSKQAPLKSTGLSTKSDYVHMLSHEVRTPLTTICSSADLIQKFSKNGKPEYKNVPDPRIKEHAGKIRESAYRIIELLDNIIAVNRLESTGVIHLQDKIDVIPFINNTIHKVKLNFEITPEIRTVFKLHENSCLTEKKLLDLIFSNLISNSIKFSVSCEPIEINLQLSNCILKFNIRDRGIGISALDKPNLFQPYFRGNNTEDIPGNGLGMYIVKKAVDLLKGQINVKSRLNTGTRFIVQIPVEKI